MFAQYRSSARPIEFCKKRGNSKRFIHFGLLTATCLSVAVLSSPLDAQAENWPTKPIRVVVAGGVGAPNDTMTRLIQPIVTKALGKPIVVEDKPGAGGTLSSSTVVRANDGHTFWVGPDAILTTTPQLEMYQDLDLDSVKELVPLTTMAAINLTLVCSSVTGIKSVKDLLERAKSQNLQYATGGKGSPGHMAMEMLTLYAGVKMSHVPYRGPSSAMRDLLVGDVSCAFLAGPTVAPYIKDGRLVALGVSGGKRSPIFPNVPTIAEAGIKGYDATFYEVLAAPANMPAEARQRMQKAVVEALKKPDIRAALIAQDMVPIADSSEEAVENIRETAVSWRKVLEQIGMLRK